MSADDPNQYRLHYMFVLCLVAGADAKLDQKELKLVHQLAMKMPEFQDMAVQGLVALVKQATDKINTYKSPQMATLFFRNMKDLAAKKKVFKLANQMAMAEGKIGAAEQLVLDKLKTELELSDEEASNALLA